MYVIAIVGAGGKTSRIKNLTKEYVQQGKKVLVTTTTHMGLEQGMVLSDNLEDIRQQLEKQKRLYLWKSGERRKNSIVTERYLRAGLPACRYCFGRGRWIKAYADQISGSA